MPAHAALALVVDALHKGSGLGCGQAQVQGDELAVLHLQQLGMGGVDLAAQQAFQGVGHEALQVGHALQRHLGGGEQGLGHGVGVGAHQAARAQLDAAKVPHHGGQHAFEVLVAQHVEHGAAGGAAGFAVVHGGRLATREQRPADVGGARVFFPQRIDMRLGAGAVGHGLHAADEAAFLDDEFAVRGGGQGVGHGGSSLPPLRHGDQCVSVLARMPRTMLRLCAPKLRISVAMVDSSTWRCASPWLATSATRSMALACTPKSKLGSLT